MGQKINPKSIRITGYGGSQNEQYPSGFANIWFSDYKYCSLFFQDIYIKKNQIRILMKYYKNRVRFLKGRHRRLKSLLRFNFFSCLHLPYKIILLCSIHRHSVIGLQRKHTAFIYKLKKTLSHKKKQLYRKQKTDLSYKLLSRKDNPKSFFKILANFAGLLWKNTINKKRREAI